MEGKLRAIEPGKDPTYYGIVASLCEFRWTAGHPSSSSGLQKGPLGHCDWLEFLLDVNRGELAVYDGRGAGGVCFWKGDAWLILRIAYNSEQSHKIQACRNSRGCRTSSSTHLARGSPSR